MEILIIGTAEQAQECRHKFGGTHTLQAALSIEAANDMLAGAEVVLDFATPGAPEHLTHYERAPKPVIFFDTSLIRLSSLLEHNTGLKNKIFGFCGLRTFIDREILEVTLRNETDRPLLESFCAGLGTVCQVVTDQAGMVTPRVICMVINEAYYALEEGTASRADIDLAMKLGTNYPWGPFEWGDRIGLENVYLLLMAVLKETNEERYKICPLLAKGISR